MRKLITQLIKALPVLALMLSLTAANAQRLTAPRALQDFETSIHNVIVTTTGASAYRQFSFDLYLLDTDPANQLVLAGYQAGVYVNPAVFPAGATITTVIFNNATYSELIPAQQPTAIQFDLPTSTVNLAGRVPPGPGIPYDEGLYTPSGTIISTAGFGTRICRIRVTSSVVFNTNLAADLAFNSSFVVVPEYATRVAHYDDTEATIVWDPDQEAWVWGVPPLNVQLDVVPGEVGAPGTNAHVYENPILNPAACTNATAFSVTGTGSYCEGGAGVEVGLSGSQVGVNYTLDPGGDIVAGTGNAISFGLKPAGTYTVSGIGTIPEICAVSVPMTGSAVVTMTPASTVEVTESACDSYTWALNGETYTVSGDYTYVDGCVTNILHLTITPSSTVEFTAAACDSYTWDLNGETYTVSGDYTYVDGCVTNILHLTITPSGNNEYTVSACDSYTWAISGETYTVSGDYTYINGCSTNILHLTITPSSTVEFTAAACDSYMWDLNGETYTVSGDYTYVDGCVTNILHLTITPSSTVEFTAAACDSYTWDLNGETYTVSGDYTYVDGCVTNILHLTITPSGNNEYTVTACDSYTWAISGETYTVSGDYTFMNGCSTNVLHLTIIPSSTVDFDATACDSYTWALDGQTYTASGDYPYVDGCVTTILHLTITPSITPAVSIVASANPVNEGESVTFTATADVGTPIQYVWTVDGIPSGTDNFQFTYMPEDGDMVQVQIMVSETCVTSPTANSNIITMVVNPVIPVAAVWTGGANDNDWFTAGNWDVNAVPDATTDVTIPGGLGDNYPSTAGACNNLLVADGASLMVNPMVGGTATVESFVTADQYHYISSPVTSASAGSAFPLSTFMRKYDELQPTQQWVNIVAADILTPFTGFSTFIPAATGDHTATYVGTLNDGDFSNSGLTFTDNSTINYDGYNLVGNPYASRIDLEAGVSMSNVDNAIYFWNPALNAYSYWVIGGGGVNGASANVPVGQGFFVKVSTPGVGTFGVSNAVRTNAVQPFYKSTLNNVVRLKVEGDIYSDETMVLFNQQATSQFDSQFDAFKLKASEVNHMYTKTSDGLELAINTLTSIEQNTSIPVYFEVAHSGMYNITASELETIAGNIPVWLEDLKTGTVQNLRENAVYAFNANVNDNANRFKLTFATLGVVDKPLQNINIWSVDKNIHMQLPVVVKGNVRLTNAAGQNLINTEINAVGEYVIHAPVAAGIYMVTITSNEGTVTKKVFVK